MGKMYHMTKKGCLSSILSEGLKPPMETGIQNTYDGIRGDNRFVYLNSFRGALLNKKRIDDGEMEEQFWNSESVLLEITLPENHPIERDFDQVLLIYRWWHQTGDKRKFYSAYFKKKFNVEFDAEPTDDNIIKFCAEKVTDEEWENKFSAYRTRSSIPPGCLKVIRFEDL